MPTPPEIMHRHLFLFGSPHPPPPLPHPPRHPLPPVVLAPRERGERISRRPTHKLSLLHPSDHQLLFTFSSSPQLSEDLPYPFYPSQLFPENIRTTQTSFIPCPITQLHPIGEHLTKIQPHKAQALTLRPPRPIRGFHAPLCC